MYTLRSLSAIKMWTEEVQKGVTFYKKDQRSNSGTDAACP